jgi:hypothetical protein
MCFWFDVKVKENSWFYQMIVVFGSHDWIVARCSVGIGLPVRISSFSVPRRLVISCGMEVICED